MHHPTSASLKTWGAPVFHSDAALVRNGSVLRTQVFGNSPDETAYCRLVLNRETVPDALVMIQPTLLAYSLDAPPTPVRMASGQSKLRGVQ